MPFTKLQIISLSLTYLGKGPITSIPAAGEFASAVENAFDMLYPSKIAKNNWRFATKIDELSLIGGPPSVTGWQYEYQLPGDYLALFRLYSNTLDFQIFADKLYANNSPLSIEYRFLPAVTALPAYFVEYFAYLLAETYALSVSNQTNYAKEYGELTQKSFIEALATDAQSHPSKGIQDFYYINVRGGRVSSSS